jgi:hypothetical protein
MKSSHKFKLTALFVPFAGARQRIGKATNHHPGAGPRVHDQNHGGMLGRGSEEVGTIMYGEENQRVDLNSE